MVLWVGDSIPQSRLFWDALSGALPSINAALDNGLGSCATCYRYDDNDGAESGTETSACARLTVEQWARVLGELQHRRCLEFDRDIPGKTLETHQHDFGGDGHDESAACEHDGQYARVKRHIHTIGM
jgi:hypothetical protein